LLEIYESVVKNRSVGILVIDTRGSVLFVNDAAKQILELKDPSKINAKTFPVDLGNVRQALREGTFKVDVVSLGERGRKILVHSSRLVRKGETAGILHVFVPLGAQEQELTQRMDSYGRLAFDPEAIIENTYDGLYITDGDANTLLANKAYERITGIKRSEILGKNMKDLVSSGVFDRSVSLEVLEKGEPITIMQELRSGKKVLVTGSPVFDKATSKIVLVVTNVRDITELIELKEKLHERTLEANRYLAELDKMKILQQQEIKFAAKSKKILDVLDTAIKAAQFDSNILITGESGVGKGLLARLIHETSGRKKFPFIVVNCASIPDDLFESELFGYEPGAFSGASVKGKKGLLEVADKGSVFLDEIGDMSLRLQAKLLRVIEEKEMIRLGSTKTIKLNVRVITATNQDLKTLIEEKRFRQDLFFRLNTIGIVIPPLRERREDILPLIQYFMDRLKERYGMQKEMSPQVTQTLMNYYFAGNVRELSNIIEQGFLISRGQTIELEDLPPQVKGESGDLPVANAEVDGRSYTEIVSLIEYRLLKSALEKYGSTHKAARGLKMSQSTIVRKMKKFHAKGTDAF
jgi:PAS domain S-box-containing protein